MGDNLERIVRDLQRELIEIRERLRALELNERYRQDRERISVTQRREEQ